MISKHEENFSTKVVLFVFEMPNSYISVVKESISYIYNYAPIIILST